MGGDYYYVRELGKRVHRGANSGALQARRAERMWPTASALGKGALTPLSTSLSPLADAERG